MVSVRRARLLGRCLLLVVAGAVGACHRVLPLHSTPESDTASPADLWLGVSDGDVPPDVEPPAGPDMARLPDAGPLDTGSGVPGAWVTIPAGTFTMGSPASEPCRSTLSSVPKETQRVVKLSRSFSMQATEVTQDQFALLMGYNPSYHGGCGNCPVEQVTWHEAAAYCRALSKTAGLPVCYADQGTGSPCGAPAPCADASEVCINGACQRLEVLPSFSGSQIYQCNGYRLPTEAEWEYAYRAGTATPYYSGTNDGTLCTQCAFEGNVDVIGWYCKNSGGQSHPVGLKQANGWGLFDMGGNVQEWCHHALVFDPGSAPAVDPSPTSGSSNFVIRGGAFNKQARFLRAAYRFGDLPHQTDNDVGFRCVRSISP